MKDEDLREMIIFGFGKVDSEESQEDNCEIMSCCMVFIKQEEDVMG